MIILDEVKNISFLQNTCLIDNYQPFTKNHIIYLPIDNEDSYYNVLNKIKGNKLKLRIKSINRVYIPRINTGKLGSSQLNYIGRKEYKIDQVRASNNGYTIQPNPTAYQQYNVALNTCRMVSKMKDKTLNPTTSSTYLYYILNLFKGFTKHQKRYVIFTPEVCKISLKNDASIRNSAYKVNNFYIKVLHQFKYNFIEFLTYLQDNDIKFVFTDYTKICMIDFSIDKLIEAGVLEDGEVINKKTYQKFIMKFFSVIKRFKMGYDVKEDSEISDDEIVRLTFDEVTVEKAMDEIEDDTIASGVIKAADFTSDTNEEVEELSNSIIQKLQNKEKKDEIIAEQITEIIEKSKGVDKVVPEKLQRLKKRQSSVVEKNSTDLMETLDLINNLLIPEKVNNTGIDAFNQFSIKNMDKQYAEKHARTDRIKSAKQLNESSVPLFLTNYKEKETTLSTTKGKDVQYTFESPVTKERHTFTVTVPELRDDKFLHLNGSDKVMIRQKLALPVIKLSNSVIITTYYNKVTIYKTVGNLTPFIGKVKSFTRYLKKNIPTKEYSKYFDLTPCFHTQQFKNSLPYELLEMSRYISKITINEFNYIDLNSEQLTPKGNLIIGKLDGVNVECNKSNEALIVNGEKIEPLDLLSSMVPYINNSTLYNIYNKVLTTTNSKNIMYNKATLLNQNIPILYVLLISENYNLHNILERAKKDYGLEYRILPFKNGKKQPRLYNKYEGDEFLFDGFTLNIRYKNVPNRSLFAPLLNSDMSYFNTLNIEDLVRNEIKSNTILYIENYVDLLIDPITKDVLKDINLPEDFTGVFMYANALMFYYDRELKEIDLRNERMPSIAEIIQGALIKATYDAYATYSIKKKRGARNPSFGLEKNSVVNILNTLPNVEESSKLNPPQHVDKLYTVSNKGQSGVNNSRSYTMEKRDWNRSFYGNISMVSPYDAGTGIKKHLVMNPNITDIRGYFNQPKEDIDKLKVDELLSVTEGLSPFASRHDSSPRVAMSMQQTNHTIATKGSSAPLVSMGMDESIAYLDTDFVFSAKENGTIVELNEKFIKIEYGTGDNVHYEVFQMAATERNSAKSFFISNNMVLNKDLKIKVGRKVKKGDIIAYNKDFYTMDGSYIVYKSGPIVNVAISHTQYSYEDAIYVSESFAKKMESTTVKQVVVKLSPHDKITNFNYNIGDNVNSGDLLMSYLKDTGSDILNTMFNVEAYNESMENKIESYYRGKLKDIYITYKLTDQMEKETDPTILKTFKNVEDMYNTLYKTRTIGLNLPKYEVNRTISHVSKLTDTRRNKVNGIDLDKNEILIEFFIEVEETFTTGDKMTACKSALKGIVSEVMSDEDRPYGITTGRIVDIVLSPYSPLARMVPSVIKEGILTYGVQETTKLLIDILNEPD